MPPRAGSVSTIAWIGYDSPNFNPESMMPWDLATPPATSSTPSPRPTPQAGGLALSQFVDGLNSTHTDGDQPHLTVIGHSYGSTTSSYAAAGGMDADSLVLIGSPGASGGVGPRLRPQHADRPGLRGRGRPRPLSWLGGEDGVFPGTWDDDLGLGADPAQHDFGAINFAVDNGQEFHGTGLVTTGFMENHVNYFDDPNAPHRHTNEALVNLANIAPGNTEAARRHGRSHAGGPRLPLRLGRRRGAAPRGRPGRGDLEGVRDGVVETYEGVRDGVVEDAMKGCATASSARSTAPATRGTTCGRTTGREGPKLP